MRVSDEPGSTSVRSPDTVISLVNVNVFVVLFAAPTVRLKNVVVPLPPIVGVVAPSEERSVVELAVWLRTPDTEMVPELVTDVEPTVIVLEVSSVPELMVSWFDAAIAPPAVNVPVPLMMSVWYVVSAEERVLTPEPEVYSTIEFVPTDSVPALVSGVPLPVIVSV